MYIFELQEQLDELNRDMMNEDKFWGAVNAMAELGGGGFEYGRDILNNDIYERTYERKYLPYENIPLFLGTNYHQYGSSSVPIIVSVKGLMRSGVVAPAKLKASISLSEIT